MHKSIKTLFAGVIAITFLAGCNSKQEKTLNFIKIESSTKLEYEFNEEFVNPIVSAYYSDNSNKDVSSLATSKGYDKGKSGLQTIDVSYTEQSITKTAQYKVTVKEQIKTLNSIELASQPKTMYEFNEEFQKVGVIASFSDGSSLDVSKDATWKGDYTNVAGEHKVEISYTYGTDTRSTSYNVTVGNAKRSIKFAIFADVQLCNDENITTSATDCGAAVNLGSTANAPLALKNNLEYCKKNNINTILMNGDVTNQANPHYYDYFDRIFKSVYGEESDTNPYPEIIWNMGNHEWWNGTTEKEGSDINAIKLFRQYANINSEYLVKESAVKYSVCNDQNVPSYYKVINGVPFLVISGENSSGYIGETLYGELETWLSEIKDLNSVKAGGPIFVQYHYALNTSMTHGQGAGSNAATVEKLLKNTPNAVVFTGDTHFSGVNERAINQVDFTTINLGSSSYSRMVDESAVECSDFYNVGGGSGKSDKAIGNLKYKEAYTPTIQVIDLYQDNKFTIDRYFTSEGGQATQVGKTWTIETIKSKDDFKYTNDRFQNTKASEELYGASGLSWETSDKVSFGINPVTKQMTVRFKDVKEHHFCEHYKIDVNGEIFDVTSNYYKYLESREDNYYVLDVTEASTYKVKVTAYDFFDNPSLTILESETNDINACLDSIDAQAPNTYSDIQVRSNICNSSLESNSAIEYFYQGKYVYKYGAILSILYKRSASAKEDCRDLLTIKDTDSNVAPIIKAKVKNLSTSDINIGITVVDSDDNWKTDFGVEYQKTISPGTWQEVSWNLYDDFKFTSALDISQLSLKAKLANPSSEGYSMNFLIDDLDVVGETIVVPEKGTAFNPAKHFVKDLNTALPISTSSITFDIKFTSDSDTKIAVMFGDGWNDYIGYYDLYSTTKAGDYNGLTSVELQADGYIRYVFKLSECDKNKYEGSPESINLFYIRTNNGDGWTTATGYAFVLND